jgi:hypothetical protein
MPEDSEPPAPPTPSNPPERTPDSHGISPRTCSACGADATNYGQCPICGCLRLIEPD